MKLSLQLKENIEKSVEEFRRSNPFFMRIKEGRIGDPQVRLYLLNVRYLFEKTTEFLSLARNLCKERNDIAGFEFFSHRYDEEYGHKTWAENDLKQMGEEKFAEKNDWINPSLIELMDYLQAKIEKEPRLYLSYIAHAEYLTTLLATEFLNELEEKCGVQKENMTAIDNHGEVDKEHALEDFDVIDELVEGHVDEVEFLDIQKEAEKYFEPFWQMLSETKGIVHA